MANKQLRKMIICEIFRLRQCNYIYFCSVYYVTCALYELRIAFDYCSVHVSTLISHVSQQFRFLVFFIVTVRMNFMHFVIAMGCFDYCSVHVSTVISHVSQQFRFLVFFIVTVRMNFMHFVIAMGFAEWIEKMNKNLNGLHHQHRARSYSCVSLSWLNGVTQYWSRNLCGFAYHR
ncbi:hypothetical protein T07_9124, partial [Trichinella nelsoni]